MSIFHRRNNIAAAERDARRYTELSRQLRESEPERAAQREEARNLRERGEAAQTANHFGETIEMAMRSRRSH